jgi:homoserine kinase
MSRMRRSWDAPAGPVTVSAPATSANLGPGFDALGVALDLTDEVTAQVLDDGFMVEVSGAGEGEVPTGADHLIVATMLTTFSRLGVPPPPGLRLTCANRIPHARGLGSSSAAIVAGILLARALADADKGDGGPAALALAAELEGHPDNIAPCLLGGFTIAWTSPTGAEAVRLTPSEAVRPVVFVPEVRGLTAQARAALPKEVPHSDAAFNLGRTALLVHALTEAPELLLRATEDRLHQPYRAASMPQTADLVAELRAAGIPAVVSGAGPSVLALTGEFAPPCPPPPAGWTAQPLSWSLAGAGMVDSGHAGGDPVAGGRVR